MSDIDAGEGRMGHFFVESLDEARVADFMHGMIVTCTSSTPLAEVAERMTTMRIHSVVVLQEFGRGPSLELGWGIVSDLDLVAAAAAGQGARTAGEIAASPPVTIDRDEPLARAAQLMAEHNTSHLMVVATGRERPVGVISTLDIARCLALRAGPSP
jgi:CBS domain-containing protein